MQQAKVALIHGTHMATMGDEADTIQARHNQEAIGRTLYIPKIYVDIL